MCVSIKYQRVTESIFYQKDAISVGLPWFRKRPPLCRALEGKKRQTLLNNQNKWKEHESQVEYRKAHSQQKANLLSPLAEKSVRDFSGRREKNWRERKLFFPGFPSAGLLFMGKKKIIIGRRMPGSK